MLVPPKTYVDGNPATDLQGMPPPERANDAQPGLKQSISINPAALKASPKFLNGEVHHWYRLILGYPDHLVASLLERIEVTKESRVLDPFCGSGTTLVECMKRGVRAVGVDANPASVVATQTKTEWTLDPERFRAHGSTVRASALQAFRRGTDITKDATYLYLESSGMLKRGWISDEPLRQALAIKRHLRRSGATPRYKRLLELCLISEVVYGASNVKFGPEIYCGPKKASHDVFAGFEARVEQGADDLAKVREIATPRATVLYGDSRECDRLPNGVESGSPRTDHFDEFEPVRRRQMRVNRATISARTTRKETGFRRMWTSTEQSSNFSKTSEDVDGMGQG